jgi:hypothetical protein
MTESNLDKFGTVPRWVALGLPEDASPINVYIIRNEDRRARDSADTPVPPPTESPKAKNARQKH